MKMEFQTPSKYPFWQVFFLLATLVATPTYAAQKPVPTPAKKVVPMFDQVKAKAAALAKKDYAANQAELPPFLSDLNYDQYRDIRFRPDHSLWRDGKLPFETQFFSRGSIFRDRVLIRLVENGEQIPFNFDSSMFDFGRLPVPMEVPKDLGFAGFRLHYPINSHQYFD
jgi:glucans biosynthesis protein